MVNHLFSELTFIIKDPIYTAIIWFCERMSDMTHPLWSPTFTANTRCLPSAGLMLAQRRRRWANIDPALGEHLVFAGIYS